MTFTSKRKLATKLSDLESKKFFSYGKARVSGNKQSTYIMHCRSACMPGQSKLFVENSTSFRNQIYDNEMIQMRKKYKRERFKEEQQVIGIKTPNQLIDTFTYKNFSPYDDDSLTIAIIAAYKQVFGNFQPMESECLIDSERRLRNGDIPIREFIRELAKSQFYRSHFVEIISQKKCIELTYFHLLGRPLMDGKELEASIKTMFEKGFEFHIDCLINSLEYEEIFGEDIVPFQRFWNSPYGASTDSFINTASFNKGFASSDNVITN